MKLLAPILFSTIFAANIFESNQEANTFLSRSKRANQGLEEWTASDLMRECGKETCDKQEFIEAAENFFDDGKTGVDEQFDDLVRFESEYVACKEAILNDENFRLAAGIDENGIREIDGFS